jgi:hypothetical protein
MEKIRTIKLVCLILLSLVWAGPAAATTYLFDIALDSPIFGATQATGFIETDGTLGALTAANIAAWSVSWQGTELFSSTAVFGGPAVGSVFALDGFTATATTLSVTGLWEFQNGVTLSDGSHASESLGVYSGTNLELFYRSEAADPLAIPQVYRVVYGSTDLTTDVIARTASISVPLPASAILLLTGLAAIGCAARLGPRQGKA